MEATIQTPTSEERTLALVAHASILLTYIIAFTTGGLGTLAAMLIPFSIWLVYRERSPYVAFHAMQATVFQLASLLAMLALGLTVGGILAVIWAITGLLSLLIVGIILIPVAVILSVLAAVGLGVFPLICLGYGLTAAWQVYVNDNFRYRWVADWVQARL